jgi:hypothetical protein
MSDSRIEELIAKASRARVFAAVVDPETASNLRSYAVNLEAEAARLRAQMTDGSVPSVNAHGARRAG